MQILLLGRIEMVVPMLPTLFARFYRILPEELEQGPGDVLPRVGLHILAEINKLLLHYFYKALFFELIP